ncbi:hypothetical protein IKF28_02435 [Candidatus Saccharibacteria bacterium]|nr:hypothetical protein [Candidatus Saccharibacteria bacterium]MBR3122280.1 hypothetical protein [Candidatus Saccharibacteria bacterium]
MKKNKKGAASFYIVAFSTLILIIIAMSFAAVIISEMTRTSNDDLAQSAYDSALAGIEDAKLAYYNYRNCLKKNPNTQPVKPNSSQQITCEGIVWHMKNPSCNMVSAILGRGSDTVAVKESNVTGNNMQQYYTCVKLDDTPKDILGSLSPSNMLKVIEPKFDTSQASDIKKIKIKWYSDKNMDSHGFNFSNFDNTGVNGVTYKGLDQAFSAPPTIFVAVIQTSGASFSFSSFNVTSNGETNRGMIFLTPTEKQAKASSSMENDSNGDYLGAFKNGENYIGKNALLKSNDKTSTNLPYVVFCRNLSAMEGNDYSCEATIELPDPINTRAGYKRNNDTFRIVLGLPYGAPDTDFSLAFLCADGKDCNSDEDALEGDASVATLKDVQIEIDSTGKANDLFRRVEARLEKTDNQNLSIMGPLEFLGTGNDVLSGVVGSGSGSGQTPAITCEWNFYGNGNSPTCSE